MRCISNGREPVPSKRQVILGLPPRGCQGTQPACRTCIDLQRGHIFSAAPAADTARRVNAGDEDMVWRYATLVGLALLALTLLVAHAVTAQNSSAGNASKGRDVFLRYCAGCHGED